VFGFIRKVRAVGNIGGRLCVKVNILDANFKSKNGPGFREAVCR
jgi:hypothetical protein